MPSTATITTFYTFSATKAQAAQVNSNFDIFRGHFLPVDPTLAAASHNSYNLGSSEYFWRGAYVNNINFRGPTTTTDLLLAADTSNTFGSLQFKIGGTSRYDLGNATISANLLASGTSKYVFSFGSTYTANIDKNGISLSTIGNRNSTTTSIGTPIAKTAWWSYSGSTSVSTTVEVAGSTCTTVATVGRPVFVGIMCGNTTMSLQLSITAVDSRVTIYLERNGSIISKFPCREIASNTTRMLEDLKIPCNMMFVDIPGAGTHNYSVGLTLYSGTKVYLQGYTVAFQF
jgi:hypothetical protein